VAVTSQQAGAINPPAQREAEFEAVFLQHYQRVYGVLYRLTGNRAEAEDLALEAFLKLWQDPPGREGSLGGWLYRVATRLGFNALRAGQRRRGYESAAGRDAWEQGNTPDPSHEVERRDERASVRAALARMAERDAQLLILRHSGLTYREIATVLGVSPGSIGTLLARAERAFERAYGEGGFDASR
jgi:RNA polymerase sigma-70 factor, ECF subfamily